MALMPPTDWMFLLAETREHPMHVGGLQLFDLPPDAGPDYLSERYRELVSAAGVHEVFRRKPRRGLRELGQWSWVRDNDIDLEYHVRLSALPRPGRVRELLELVSRLHGSLLDRHRPLWELHLIEGLEGNRFAVYTKVHHALADGVTALRWLTRSLSERADRTGMPGVFNLPAAQGKSEQEREHPAGPVDRALRIAGDVAGFPAALTSVLRKGFTESAAKLPFQAPRSVLNGSITGARRFAAQSWPLERITAVRAAHGGTLNDVVLAMSAGALRRYLTGLAALPADPLVAAVPISLHPKVFGVADGTQAGNSIGFTLCELATDEADPLRRLDRIQESVRHGKEFFAGRSPLQVLGLSALAIAPLGLSPVPGLVNRTPPPFNLIISNVPGPDHALYWNGARMRGLYPLSIVLDGQALNITVTSYDGRLEFGLTGCRRNVPHLQRLLAHLEEALEELE